MTGGERGVVRVGSFRAAVDTPGHSSQMQHAIPPPPLPLGVLKGAPSSASYLLCLAVATIRLPRLPVFSKWGACTSQPDPARSYPFVLFSIFKFHHFICSPLSIRGIYAPCHSWGPFGNISPCWLVLVGKRGMVYICVCIQDQFIILSPLTSPTARYKTAGHLWKEIDSLSDCSNINTETDFNSATAPTIVPICIVHFPRPRSILA